MSIEIISLNLGVAATNCYIVGDTDAKTAVVIDPVDEALLLVETAQNVRWTIALILATHGHFDHVLACADLMQLTGAPFYIHHRTPRLNPAPELSAFIQQIFSTIPQPTHLLTDDTEIIEVGGIKLETLYTPGHAPDHVCFFMRHKNVLFGGDCLFAGSVGRTDLPYGNHETLIQSITGKLLPLGDSVQILPGHMQPTTIGQERLNNPFLQYA
jgi:glyoxylase-like metal-dependent hydrolase (beta-lactamase superfamily II)